MSLVIKWNIYGNDCNLKTEARRETRKKTYPYWEQQPPYAPAGSHVAPPKSYQMLARSQVFGSSGVLTVPHLPSTRGVIPVGAEVGAEELLAKQFPETQPVPQ